MNLIKVSFDIGGVISKYPEIFIPMIKALQDSPGFEVYILTDMHNKQESMSMLEANNIHVSDDRLLNADFTQYGEASKAVCLKEHEIDMHFDDFPAYIAEGCPVRLMVMPDINRPYYSDDWKVPNAKDDEFGRRKRCQAYIDNK